MLKRGLLGRAQAWCLSPGPGAALISGPAVLLNWGHWDWARPGLDQSWQAAIADGFTHHLQWGPALDFTYGPYGFVGFLQPLYLSTARAAFVFIFAICWLLAALVVVATRPYLGLLASGVVAWGVLEVSWATHRTADFVTLAGVALALSLLYRERAHLRPLLVCLLGALAGFAFLVKLNDGIVLLASLVLGALCLEGSWPERRRTAALGLGTLVAAFALAWAAAGQSFSNLPSFARASASLVLGYSANMGGPIGPDAAQLAWAGVAVLVGGTVVVFAVRRRPWPARVAAVLILAGWCWDEAKDGFVSDNHYPAFFRLVFTAVVLACLLRPPKWLWRSAVVALLAIALSFTPVPRPHPLVSLRYFFKEAGQLARPNRFGELQAAGRRAVIRREPLPAPVRLLVRHRSLAVEPWENIVNWALPDARFDPEPVIGSYSAYTVYTDRLDAAFLRSPRAPERALLWGYRFGFDGRDPSMDPPATMETLYCHYAQLGAAGHWQVLARVADRCGRPRQTGTIVSHFGQVVSVPRAPGEMVVASFSFSPTLQDRLEALALKPPITQLETWGPAPGHRAGGLGRPRSYRFVPGTATDPHVMSTPASLGYSARFRPGTVVRFRLTGDGWRAGTGTLKVTFWAVPMRAPGPPLVGPAAAPLAATKAGLVG